MLAYYDVMAVMDQYKNKTKSELIEELVSLQRKLAELTTSAGPDKPASSAPIQPGRTITATSSNR